MHHNKSMYVTNVEKEGPFLKIWGQIDKKSSLEVEQALLGASVCFDQGQFIPKENTLEVGSLYCAKYVDGKYYRAKITSISPINDGMVEVYFIDYGNKDLIPVSNLRTVECFNGWFNSLPPLSTAFILAEVVCIGGEWNDLIVDQISKEIRYMEHNYIIVAQAIRYYFIKVFVHDIDLGLHLVRQNLMQSTSIQTQEAVLLAMIPRAVPSVAPPNQSLLQYKSFTLEPHSQHEIYVSYITDGPSHFSVQLKKYESTLAQLMREINSIPLKPLEELPIPGTVCLAKCVEDNHICRAVVTSEVDSLYKLFYVDFGNTELVPPENLYQMAFKFIIPKIMAIRLSLAGVEKTSITLDMQCAFKHFVDNRLLMMEVLPAAKKMALPKCRMWDPVSNIDVIDVLNRAAQNAYPDLIALHKGFTQLVKVSFVYSCNRFYVQLKSKEAELIQLMKDLQVYGNSNQTCYLAEAKVGQPCCALFSFDQKWYRCVITEIEETRAKIRYIDFGNEEFVSIDSLKVVDGEYLTILRPQAIECCLNGYQNMSEDQERDFKLEELILEQEFIMKVIDSIGGKTLIDLMDASNTTVTALLLESIMAQAKVQNIVNVPENTKHESSTKRPGLVEERRGNDDRNTKQYFHHDDRRSPRGQNWKEKAGDNNSSWRQSPRNRSDSNSNESTGSWRQDNRGFKNRKENDWNDRPFKDRGFRNRTDNGEKERHQRNRNQSDNVSGNESWIHGRSQRNTNGDRNSSNSRGDRSWTDNQGYKKKYDDEKKEWENNDNGDFREHKTCQGLLYNLESCWYIFQENNRNNQHGKGDWNNKTEKGDWNDKTERNNKNKRSETNDWNCSEKKTYKERSGDWNANKGSFENTIGDRQHNNRGDFKKKSLRRELNEHSSSGSEKSFGRGHHNYSRNDNRPPRADKKFGSKTSNNSWNNSAPAVAIDSARSDAKFKSVDVSERQEKVTISWFHNPCSFFCQLLESQEPFKQLMEEIQQAYKGRPSESCINGAPVVALFPEDNVLYRATVIEVLSAQYKVHYVDFGNVSVVDKVWPIENKFMEMPMQAIPCGLKSLEPAGDDWPNPDNYSEYFEREDLNCFFSCRDENGRYWVNITVGNEDITQQLVNNALAKYLEPIPSNVEIELFVGQQFRAMLQQVNSCSDFSMILQSGFTFHCSLHNLAAATEINEDLLRQQLQQILIVYVDDLVENRLEVTLYDATGSKLNIIEPDEGAFDTVDLPCPYFVVSSTLHGTVSHVSDSTVIIQPSECYQNIEYLLEHLFEYYENLPPADDPLVPEEGSVYAVKSNDGNWYRGEVTTFNDDTVEVTYLEYGNVEQVEFSRLRELIPDHLMWDAQAIAVNVKVPTDDFLDQEVIAKIYYGESSWEGELQLASAESEQPISSESQPKEEEVVESNQETNFSLEQTNETATIDANDEPTEIIHAQVEEAVHISDTPENSAYTLEEKDNIHPVGGTSVVLSHIDSPSDFYIQLVDSLVAIDELKQRLQDDVGEMTELESVSVGGLCAAPYTLDQQWYRSQILDADDDITTVRFIDYGNTDVISNDVTQLKTLPADLLTLEEYATRCRLKIKSSEEDWSKAAVQRFEELTAIDNLIVEFIDQDEKANYVELYSNGENVKDILIAENLALLDDVVLEGKLTGFVSHINSPSEFWVQLESCCAELEWIAEQLSNAGSFQDLEDLTPGSLCAAMFQDDEMWYRARILSNTVAGLEVLFLDYGNSCVCSNLKQLPEHLVMAPPLAQKCSLQKPEGVTCWSSKASEKFSELSADGKTIFTVKKISSGEASIVELFMNSEEVSTKLLMYNDHDKESDPTVSSVEQTADVEDRLEKNISQENEQECCMVDDIGENKNFAETSIEEKEVLLTTKLADIELDSKELVNNEQKTAEEEQKSDGNSEDISSVDCKESSVEKFEKVENEGNK
ncbi:hypothetical protein WA026_003297 [Henosepilachna vigintioctopunctata]|uniref:Tudor domain-containing protein n=1 Tax=Henosepilachna vigintioctopunctata TaxID=420089 RepID=A0AAW1TMW9_9CUCU